MYVIWLCGSEPLNDINVGENLIFRVHDRVS